MLVFELLIKCPHCESMTRLLTQDANPLIFSCGGCSKNIVINGESIFTVNSPFIDKLFKKHKTQPCGQVIITDVSNTAKTMVTESKIKELHKILKDDCDVNEFIKRL